MSEPIHVFRERIRLADGVHALIARCRSMAEARAIAEAKGLKWTRVPDLGWIVVAPTDPDTGVALLPESKMVRSPGEGLPRRGPIDQLSPGAPGRRQAAGQMVRPPGEGLPQRGPIDRLTG